LCAFSRQNVLLMESRVEAVIGGWSGLRPTAALVGVGSPLTKNPICEPSGERERILRPMQTKETCVG
jgi:hypothetical protein